MRQLKKNDTVRQKIYSLTLLALILSSCGIDKTKTPEKTNNMLKLYKLIDNQLNYWETWDKDDKTAIVHWGIVGQRGQDKEVKGGLFSNFRKIVQKEIDEKQKEGYAEIDEDKVSFLEIEYKIDGFGTEQDLDKRHRLEERMDQVLGWTGLGHTDGGSSGSGTMEVGCVVVDFDIAKKVIEQDLKSTEFANYTRVFKMNE
jgi:predicted DNA-binding WGR domain protein